MNAYRLQAGYVDHAFTQGGPAAYIGNLRPWDHILKDTLYATQENLGSAAAVNSFFFRFTTVGDLCGSLDLPMLGLMERRLESHRVAHHVARRQPQLAINSPMEPIHTNIVLQSQGTQFADYILLFLRPRPCLSTASKNGLGPFTPLRSS